MRLFAQSSLKIIIAFTLLPLSGCGLYRANSEPPVVERPVHALFSFDGILQYCRRQFG